MPAGQRGLDRSKFAKQVARVQGLVAAGRWPKWWKTGGQKHSLLPHSCCCSVKTRRSRRLLLAGRLHQWHDGTSVWTINCPAADSPLILNDNSVEALAESLHQVGPMLKAVFVKESYITLGIKPKTYSYPGRTTMVLKKTMLNSSKWKATEYISIIYNVIVGLPPNTRGHQVGII